jgi:hypothetical protein
MSEPKTPRHSRLRPGRVRKERLLAEQQQGRAS